MIKRINKKEREVWLPKQSFIHSPTSVKIKIRLKSIVIVNKVTVFLLKSCYTYKK